jgi:hypothetical protein
MTLSDAAKQARRDYARRWRNEHQEELNAYLQKWRADNPEKVKLHQKNFWEKLATTKA